MGSIWCVEVLFKKGGCEFVIFDDFKSAQEFVQRVRHGTHRRLKVKDADVWEM